jgi:hypothetical protein
VELRLAVVDLDGKPEKPPPPPPSYQIARTREACRGAGCGYTATEPPHNWGPSTESMLLDIGPGLRTSINPGENRILTRGESYTRQRHRGGAVLGSCRAYAELEIRPRMCGGVRGQPRPCAARVCASSLGGPRIGAPELRTRHSCDTNALLAFSSMSHHDLCWYPEFRLDSTTG